MKTAFFSSHKFEHNSISKANNHKHELVFIEDTLSKKSIPLAEGCEAICIFVNDKTDAFVIWTSHLNNSPKPLPPYRKR